MKTVDAVQLALFVGVLALLTKPIGLFLIRVLDARGRTWLDPVVVGLTIHNFTSAAVGIAIAAALVRGITAHSTQTLGNFWIDIFRVNYYLLVPASLVYAPFLVSQGVVQNISPYTHA